MQTPVKVLFLTRYPIDGASSRYRVYQYLPYLESLGVSYEVQSFMDERMYQLSFIPNQIFLKFWLAVVASLVRIRVLLRFKNFDIIYMQRELLPFGPPWIERYMKKRGAILLFDYDDALFIKKPSRYNQLATLFRAPSKIFSLFEIVDCVVAGNDWLRDQAQKRGCKAVTIEVAEDTTRIKMRSTHSNLRPVRIGWLGSKSTVKYLRLIQPVLQRIATCYPEVEFETMGGGDFHMEGVSWEHSEWSLSAELQALNRFDIGLMPLPFEEWAEGKSGGKARTYMAAGVVPVCSAIGYNLELISHGETGFLCSDEHEWFTTISTLIESAELRDKVAISARADVKQRFSPAQQAEKLFNLFQELNNASESERYSK